MNAILGRSWIFLLLLDASKVRAHRSGSANNNWVARTSIGPRSIWTAQTKWGVLTKHRDMDNTLTALLPRGGAAVDNEENDDESEAHEEEDDDEEEEYDDESDDESEISGTDVEIEMKVAKFDDPLVASPLTNLYASFGVMFLARKYDLFNPTIVKIARMAFIAYLVLLQLFLLYVRIQAKTNNDRTPIELKNPLSSVLQSKLGGGLDESGNNMMKNLASSFLASKSTAMEYDLKQARSMQSGLIFNMMFMWFLHFKMEQVQPLLIQTANGITSMVYSPLFQVYVLGRNLERPFKNAAMQKMEDAAAAQKAQTDSADDEVIDAESTAKVDDREEEYFSAAEEEDDADAAVDDESDDSDGSSDDDTGDDESDDSDDE